MAQMLAYLVHGLRQLLGELCVEGTFFLVESLDDENDLLDRGNS